MFVIKKEDIVTWFQVFMLTIVLGENFTVQVIFNKVASRVLLGMIDGTTLLYLVFWCGFIGTLNRIINNLIKKKAWDVGITTVVMLFVLLFFNLSGRQISIGISNQVVVRILLLYLPSYILARSIMDYNLFMDKLWFYAYVILAMNIYAISSPTSTLQQGYETHMVQGYQITLAALILFDNYFQTINKNVLHKINLIVGIISVGIVVFLGSRGSFVTILCFGVYMILCRIKKANIQTIVLLIIIGVFITIVRENIIALIYSTFVRFELSSRTIDWFLGMNSELSTSGRDNIYRIIFESILDEPLGVGVFGDRLILGGMYTHNFILELLCDFGLIIGGLFVITIIANFIHSLFDETTRRASSVIGLYSFGLLSFSSSYLLLGSFWVALGIIMSGNNKTERDYSCSSSF